MSELSREEIRTLMKEEYQEAKKAGNPITAISLAKKYNKPPGTVRRWRSEDNWDERKKKKQSERSDEHSDKQMNVRHEHIERSKYDWHKLKRKFLTGNYQTLSEFAQKNNLNAANGNFKKKTKGWLEEKEQVELAKSTQIIEKSIQKTTDKASDVISETAVNIAQNICELIEQRKLTTLNLTKKILEKAGIAIDKVDVQLLKKRTITRSNFKAKVKKEVGQKVLPEGMNMTQDGDFTNTTTTMSEDIEERITVVNDRKLLNLAKAIGIAHNTDRKVLNIDKIEKETELNAKRKLEDYFS